MTSLEEWTPEAADLEVVEGAAPGSRVVAVAPFSRGPWWGFNGVQLVAVTETDLHVIQIGAALTAGRSRLVVPLSAVEAVTWRTRRGVGGRAVQLVITVDGRARRYVSKYQEAVEVGQALQQSLAAE